MVCRFEAMGELVNTAWLRSAFPALTIAAGLIAAGLSACSSSTSAPVAAGLAPVAAVRTADDVTDLTPPDGAAGLDYAPDVIEVDYLPGAVLPSGLAAHPAPDACAARQANALLRRNTGYEAVTDAIAARYGLAIRTQAYIGRCNMAAFDVPPAADGAAILAQLRSEFAPVLASAGFTPLAHAAFVPDDPDFVASTQYGGPQWGQRKIMCEAAWEYTRGDEDLLVGVVDTGSRLYHEELEGQVLNPEDYFPAAELDLFNHDNTVEDDDGHGTKIAGLIVASTNNARTIAGVADGCRVIPVKISNTASTAMYTDMAAGCLLAAELGARVVNLSWNGSSSSTNLRNMVDELAEQGVLLVVSAGNDATGNASYPAGYDNCMSAGATDRFDHRLDFSNFGDYVDIAAPGTELKSCFPTGVSQYAECEGTSFAAPLVAGGAALLWSHLPRLSLSTLRTALESTGTATTGFDEHHTVRRLDLGAALATTIDIQAPRPGRLVFHEQASLTPQPSDGAGEVQLLINGELIESRFEAPWTFDVDFSSYGFTMLDVEFRAYSGELWAADHLNLFIDNTSGLHILNEAFDDPLRFVYGLDARGYSAGLLGELKQADPAEWTVEDVRSNGRAEWMIGFPGYLGSYSARIGEAGDHGAFETDVLVTPRVNLVSTVSAALGFTSRCNLADGDRGSVLYTADDGQTFHPLEDAGVPVTCSGYQAEFTEHLYDLDAVLGQKVHFVFLFESDGGGAGENTEEDATWWVDNITISGTAVSLGGLDVDSAGVPGAVTGTINISAAPAAPENVERVEYWLDFAPLDTVDEYDIERTVDAAPFSAQFNLTTLLDWDNQTALLRARPIGASEFVGEEISVPVYLMNHLGDVNCDGAVDEADTAAYAAVL